MNIYKKSFAVKCPNDGELIQYRIKISSEKIILVEDINRAIEVAKRRTDCYHESIADFLCSELPGEHIIFAQHQGVDVETRRGLFTSKEEARMNRIETMLTHLWQEKVYKVSM